MVNLPMSSMKGREPPLKKKKKPSTEQTTIPLLPYDLLVSCLARVSRLHYQTLSLVSKSLQSLLASPELYQTRNLLGRTESCLYVCLRFPPDPNPRWFTLSRKPDQTLINHTNKNKKESSGNVLASIRILNSPTVEWSNLIAVGPYLYAINGPIEDTPCSSVSFLDCRTHTWLEAPMMLLAHTNSGFDGHMYLPGSCENPESLNCIEVLNTNTQTWKPVPLGKRIFNGGNMEGKIYMELDMISGKKGLAYNPKEMTVELVGFDSDWDSDIGWVSRCTVENINYRFNSVEGFGWFVDGSAGWRKLEGLEGLPKFAGYSNVRLADYGGKLVVLWDKYVRARGGYKEKMIWCAVILLEKRNNGEEIWGKVEWFDAVLRVPKSYEFVSAIAATV